MTDMTDMTDIPGFQMGDAPDNSTQKVLLERGYKRVLKLVKDTYDWTPYPDDTLTWAKMQVDACEQFMKILIVGGPDGYWAAVNGTLIYMLRTYPLHDQYTPGQGGFRG